MSPPRANETTNLAASAALGPHASFGPRSMKSRMETSEIVVGLDIGTTKVSAVVGEVDADGITILGVGNVPCRGLRKGVVSNIDWTVRSITDAIEAAQTMAGVEIRTVYAGVAGSHIRSQTSDGVAAIGGAEVTRVDVDRVLEGARAIPVDADRQILHVLPREFMVDNQDGIRDPVGMSGVRLGVKVVNLVTAATSCVQNVIRCVERCGLSVADVVLEPLASADAVLSEDEKEIGVAVIDMGGGTTDLLLYVDGGIAHTSVIPVGGNNVTADILVAGLPHPHGRSRANQTEFRLRPRPHGRRRRRDRGPRRRQAHAPRKCRAPRALGHHPEPRVEEIFAVLRKRIEDAPACSSSFSAGVVLTGGAVLLDGMTEFAEEILGTCPSGLGVPVGVRGITQLVAGPQYATGVGLVQFERDTAPARARARERAAGDALARCRPQKTARESRRLSRKMSAQGDSLKAPTGPGPELAGIGRALGLPAWDTHSRGPGPGRHVSGLASRRMDSGH